MSEEKIPKRLGELSQYLSIAVRRAVEFLASNGIVIEEDANKKLDSGAIDLLIKSFKSDKEIKDHALKVQLPKEGRENLSIEIGDKKKTDKPTSSEDRPLDTFELQQQAKAKAKKDSEVVAFKVNADIESTAQPKTEPELIRAKDSAQTITLKEVGNIDPDRLLTGAKRKSVPVEELAAVILVPDPPEPTVEAIVHVAVVEPVVPVKQEPELIRATAERLAGPKLVGHMDISELDSRKKRAEKIAGSAPQQNDANAKKKRKRIIKVDVNTPNQQNRPVKGKTGEVKAEVTDADIQREVKETLARLSGNKGKSLGSKIRREKRQMFAQRTEEEMQLAEAESTKLKLTEFVTVSEMANMMKVPVTQVISACMSLGIMASINQRLDAETLMIVSEEFGFQAEFVSAEVTEAISEEEDNPEDLKARPPIVTVMGHVDHGKTSLLDFIRKANVIAGEAGGITQHIGAYNVELGDGRKMAFLDTPGHEAFTAMRARGARVTDVAIIVIAADDSVMPQTREAISHAQAAGIPMVFAFNKMDKAGANADKIREELSAMNILPEEWGGKFQTQEISAKSGTNIDKLLDKVLLEAEMLDLKANPDKNASGTVLESELDKGRGYVSTVLVEGGTLKVGDILLAGHFSGRVKAMFNERGQIVNEAGPSVPVSLLGINGAPNAGDKFYVLEDEREAREIATKRQQLQREQGIRSQKHITIEEIGRRIALGEFKELNLIVKGDVDGSVEALTDSLQKLSTEKIHVNIIHRGVGQISESDVLLASASDAIVVGFQVRPSANARKLAEKESIQIRLYSIIYKAIEEIRDAMEGMLATKIEERIIGTAEVREIFKISKVGTIAGCFVSDGKIIRNNKIRLIRNGIVIHTGTLGTLKRFKDDVKEVLRGFECGLDIDRFNDIMIGDILESFEEVEVKQTLV